MLLVGPTTAFTVAFTFVLFLALSELTHLDHPTLPELTHQDHGLAQIRPRFPHRVDRRFVAMTGPPGKRVRVDVRLSIRSLTEEGAERPDHSQANRRLPRKLQPHLGHPKPRHLRGKSQGYQASHQIHLPGSTHGSSQHPRALPRHHEQSPTPARRIRRYPVRHRNHVLKKEPHLHAPPTKD